MFARLSKLLYAYVMQENIRNFVIIAHIDHGKSTLADRMLELTHTVEQRAMRPQYLDQMGLERERGITIKMQPVRMVYHPNRLRKTTQNHTQNHAEQFCVVPRGTPQERGVLRSSAKGSEFILNLIDTPGHVDFSYEVSRALTAVEGAVLLVDATKGIQAQTVANLSIAQEQGLAIVAAVNKIDLAQARAKEVKAELADVLGIPPDAILSVSAKEGLGVAELLDHMVAHVPPPKGRSDAPLRALIFDSHFDSFRGIVAHVRVVDGNISRNTPLVMMAKKVSCEALEVGYFMPQEQKSNGLCAGEIGWVATGLKDPDSVRVGDTITDLRRTTQNSTQNNAEQFRVVSRGSREAAVLRSSAIEPLAGYKEAQPVVFASLFPESEDEFEKLRESLQKLRLNDAAFMFEPEQSQALGRGFRCGFLGLLHMEITMERLRREFASNVIATAPSVRFVVMGRGGTERIVQTPRELPDRGEISEIKEPWAHLTLLAPVEHVAAMLKVLGTTRAQVGDTRTLGTNRVALEAEVPMLDIIHTFADRIKSATEGFASYSWAALGVRPGDLAKLEILVAHAIQEAFSRIVPRSRADREARALVEKLKEVLPRELFAVAIQGAVDGKIVARETISALRKDVTGYLYGGDYSRKKKLLQKQRKGKKRMQKAGRVQIPPDVFQKVLRAST